MHAYKRSLLIQCELGNAEFPAEEAFAKYKRQFQQETNVIFSSLNRLIRSIVDIQIHFKDAPGTRNALELARSFDARAWENSPFELKQIKNIGPVAVRKFVANNINSIEALECQEPHQVEMLLSRNPPFGNSLLAGLKSFPKPLIRMKIMGKVGDVLRALHTCMTLML